MMALLWITLWIVLLIVSLKGAEYLLRKSGEF